MTTKQRTKKCKKCGNDFLEKPRESNLQWSKREYCSMSCNNNSTARVTSIFERLERFQVKCDGCWKWSGAKDQHGYGKIGNRAGRAGSPERAHRVSYEKEYGSIPKGLSVCHKCDNPECTNPEHLFVGTHKENMQDCGRKGRVNSISIDNLEPNPKLTIGQVVEISNIEFCAINGRGKGERVSDVAKQYGVSNSIISAIKNKRYKRKGLCLQN